MSNPIGNALGAFIHSIVRWFVIFIVVALLGVGYAWDKFDAWRCEGKGKYVNGQCIEQPAKPVQKKSTKPKP